MLAKVGARVPLRGTTRNISSNGVLFTSSTEMTVGERAEFIIELPGGRHGHQVVLTSFGRVVRSAPGRRRGRPYLIAATLDRYELSRKPKASR